MKSFLAYTTCLLCSLVPGMSTHLFSGVMPKPDGYENGMRLKEKGKWEEALKLWQGARDQLAQTGESDPRIGVATIELVTEKKAESYYESASDSYLWGFSGRIAKQNQSAVREEAKRIVPLLDVEEADRWQKLIQEKSPRLSEEISLFWLQRDPQPITPVNERLIEHWQRIGYSREAFKKNKKSVYNCDDRGTIYVKYGEPLRTQAGRLGTSSESSVELLRISSSFQQDVRREDPHPEYEVWLYDKLSGKKSAIFLFSRRNGRGSFGLLDGVEDAIMKRGVEGSGDLRYILQLMYYAELRWFAKFYEDRHQDLEEIWDHGGSASVYRLRGQFFQNSSEDKQRLHEVDVERSDEANNFSALDVVSYAVRLLDADNRSHLSIISKASLARRNLNEKDPAFGTMVSRPQQTLIVRDKTLKPIQTLQGTISKGSGYVSVFQLTHEPDYSNYAISAEARAVAPDTFLAVGKTFLTATAPLDPNPDSLQLSDLVLGGDMKARFARANQPRIPLMPRDEFTRSRPMRAYLEVYHLQPDDEGFGHFTIEFSAHKLDENGKRSKKEGEISLTFDFDSEGGVSKQDHAIDLSKLEPGNYVLAVRVRDRVSAQEKVRQKRFTIEE